MTDERPVALEPRLLPVRHVNRFSDPSVPTSEVIARVESARASDLLLNRYQSDRPMKMEHQALDKVDRLDELFTSMFVDPSVRSGAEQIYGGVFGSGWDWEETTDPNSAKHVAFNDAHAQWLDMDDVFRSYLQAAFRGFSIIEDRINDEPIAEGEWAGKWFYKEIRFVPRDDRVITESKKGGEVVKLQDKISKEEWTPEDPEWERFVFLTWGKAQSGGILSGDGSLVAAWKFIEAKAHFVQWWLSGGERLGTPPAVATLPESLAESGLYEQTRDEALKALDEILVNFEAVLPPGWKIDFPPTNAEAMRQFYNATIDYFDDQIETAIVGQTSTSGGSQEVGSFAKSKDTRKTFNQIIKAIQRWLEPKIRDKFAALLRLNFPDVQEPPRFKFVHVDEEEQERLRVAVRDAIVTGTAWKEEPGVREVLGLEPLTPDLIAKVQENRDLLKAAGLWQEELGVPIPQVPGQVAKIPTPEADAATGAAEVAVASGVDVGKTALNGAQVTALQALIKDVTFGLASPEGTIAQILESFPTMDETKVRTMVNEAVKFEPAIVEPPEPGETSEAVTGLQAFSDHRAFDGSEILYRAADKVRRWIDEGRPIDLTRTLPLRDQFSDAYRFLGLAPDAARDQGRITANILTIELAKRWPAAGTPMQRHRLLDTVMSEITAPERLSRVMRVSGSNDGAS